MRQEGCLPELMRFIVRPRLEFAEEGSVANDDGSSDEPDAPKPDYVRRAFRSLKMLVDDPRVSEMLMDSLTEHMPVAFEIFESTTPTAWSMENRDLPSLYHWSALMHTMFTAHTAQFCQAFVDQDLMSLLLPWMTAAPVYETLVQLVAKALSQPEASAVLMEALTQTSALPEQILANLQDPAAASSALTFLGLLVERANKMRLSCVLFEHVFTADVVTQLVDAAMHDGEAQAEAVELVCWLMRTGADGTLLDRHSPKNTRLFQREPSHGMGKTWGKLRLALRGHAPALADAVATSRAGSGASGIVRLGMLELLSLLAHGDSSTGQCHFLDSLHAEFWKTSLRWCFDKPNNTVLHGHVYQLVYVALKTKHEDCLRSILDPEFDLAAQLRAAFELKSHRSMRGHILLIANSIRVAIGAEKLALASTLLADNTAWRDFQPTLRREAADQLRPIDRSVDARIAMTLSGPYMCPTRLFQPPPPSAVTANGGRGGSSSISPTTAGRGRGGMWDADELSQEMLGKVEADEQDRLLFDASAVNEEAAAAEAAAEAAEALCSVDADRAGDGSEVEMDDGEMAGADDSNVSVRLAACLGFGSAAPGSGSGFGGAVPTPPPSMPAMTAQQLSAQLIAQLNLSAPAAEQPGAVRPSFMYHRVMSSNGTPRSTEFSYSDSDSSEGGTSSGTTTPPSSFSGGGESPRDSMETGGGGSNGGSNSNSVSAVAVAESLVKSGMVTAALQPEPEPPAAGIDEDNSDNADGGSGSGDNAAAAATVDSAERGDDPVGSARRDPSAEGVGAALQASSSLVPVPRTPRESSSSVVSSSPQRIYQHTPQAPSAPMSDTPRQR